MIETISSAQNPKIKRLIALQQKSSERRESGLFVVEGRRELEHCIESGFEIETVFYAAPAFDGGSAPITSPGSLKAAESRGKGGKSLASSADGLLPGKTVSTPGRVRGRGPLPEAVGGMERSGSFTGNCTSARQFIVTPEVYEKIAYRGSTEGVIAEVRAKEMRLEDLKLKENPLIMVLESVEKPGNLGAILRSADAAGADAVIICDPLTDLFNPNLIRASIGAIFTVPCVACTSEEAIGFFKSNGIKILTAQLQDSSLYYDYSMTEGTAIVMGTESTGLTDIWRKAADAHIRIPMLGQLDSLNVSVSAAILLYEAVRQRSSK